MAREGRIDDAREILLDTVRQLETDIGADSPKTKQVRARLAHIQSTPRSTERCGIDMPDT
jgi:hypothetical protein